MEFESPDVEKEFPGLYASESGGKRSNESDFSDDAPEKYKKELLRSKEKKDSKKDRGYAALEGESSPDEADPDVRSPSKSKKTKSFKFPTSSKKVSRDKSKEKDGRESDVQKEIKEKKREKELHRSIKLRVKEKKIRNKHSDEATEVVEEPPVFNVPLEVAVQRSRCHDGVLLPRVVRDCLDFMEEMGLTTEGIYKGSGNKSKVQALRKQYNNKEATSFSDCEPATVAGLLKLFLRELPEPIIISSLSSEFEESAIKKGEGMDLVLNKLPDCNRELLGWLVLHCKHLVAQEKYNRCGGLQGVCATFSPLLQTSSRVLSALICYSATLFPGLQLTKYIPPLSGPSPAMPSSETGCQEELRKLESLLTQVHGEMNAGLAGVRREEMLWDAQRIVTQLKRKLRALQKPLEPRASDDEIRSDVAPQQEDEVQNSPDQVAPDVPSSVVPVKEEIPNDTVVLKLQLAVSEVLCPVTLPQNMPVLEKTVDPIHSCELKEEHDELDGVCFVEIQLEAVVEQLRERIAKEKIKIKTLQEELIKIDFEFTETQTLAPENDHITCTLEEIMALQEQRDSFCEKITKEREVIALYQAQLFLKSQIS